MIAKESFTPYDITLFVIVLERKTMGKERGTTEVIEECLNVKMARLGHDSVRLNVPRFIVVKNNGSKGGMRIRPH